MKRGLMIFLMINLFVLSLLSPVRGETRQIPEWFRFSAALSATPQMGKPLEVLATVTALIGDLTDIHVRLMLPAGWAPASPAANLDRIASGSSRLFTFQVQTAGALPNGSIGCFLEAKTPKAAIGSALPQAMGLTRPEADLLGKRIQQLPDLTSAFTDIAFAVYPEEGFYPLGSDMWQVYVDHLTPKGMIRGPVLYKDSIYGVFQAQTDVEMYQKLEKLVKSDPRAADSLKVSGIDLNRKTQDYTVAQYVLAVEALVKKNYVESFNRIETMEKTWKSLPETVQTDLKVAAGNVKAVCRWATGDKKGAEEMFRNTFYSQRKLPAQRYTLRNLGLLCLDRGDLSNGREMLRLSLEMKAGYSLLQEEMKLVKKP